MTVYVKDITRTFVVKGHVSDITVKNIPTRTITVRQRGAEMICKPSSFRKQPSEQFVITFDFSAVLASGETISAKTVTATKRSDGSDVTSTIIDGSSISGETILVGVKGGTDGVTYNISVLITSSSALPSAAIYAKYEADVDMVVKEDD